MIPESKIFAHSDAGTMDRQLVAQAARLFEDQVQTWPACAKGVAALDQVEIRTITVSGAQARLQWNPQRIVSTSAKVDAASIQARRCFLCVENLPPAQKGIVYGGDYLVLCNPSPIFRSHFTITHREHRPQLILDGIDSFLALANDLGEGYVVFYNGPKCGASAPDHLHFQAVPTGSIPAELQVRQAARKERLQDLDGTFLWKLPFFGRTHCIISGTEAGKLAAALRRFIGAWQTVSAAQEEPMLNLLSVKEGDVLSLLIFLRSKHRPDDYFKEADEQVMVSPASVDMGGHIVTPVEKDFHFIDGPYIERMYDEVSVPPHILTDIIHAL